MNFYKKNTANSDQIAKHFNGCNFEPSLESYVDIDEYIKKILTNAERFECWIDNELAGLVAVYCNDFKKREGFITNLSVQSKYSGKGIAKELLDKAILHCRQSGMNSVALEVFKENRRAIAIYKKNGFVPADNEEPKLKMILKLGSHHG